MANYDDPIELPHSLKELQDWSKTHPAPKPMVRASDDPTSILYNERKLDMPNSLEELQNWARKHHASGGSIDHIAKAMHLARKHFEDGGGEGGGEGESGERKDDAFARDYASSLAPSTEQQAGMMGRGLPEGGGQSFSVDQAMAGGRGLPEGTATANVSSTGFGQGENVGNVNYTGHDMPTGLISYTTQRENTPYEGTPITAAQNPSDAFGMAYPSLVGVQNTPAGAAALLANLGYESTQGGKAFQPNAISGSGYGLAQWTDPSRQAAFFNAMMPGTTANNPIAKMAILGTTTPGQQLGYAMNEIQQKYPQVAREMATAKSIPTATENIMNRYEAPATNESLDARIALANQIAKGTGLGSFAQEALNQAPSGNSFAAISPSVSSAVRSALGTGRGDVGTLDSSLAKAMALNETNNAGINLIDALGLRGGSNPSYVAPSTAAMPASRPNANVSTDTYGPNMTDAQTAVQQKIANDMQLNSDDVAAMSPTQRDAYYKAGLMTAGVPTGNFINDLFSGKLGSTVEQVKGANYGSKGNQQPLPYIPPVETAASTAPAAAPVAPYVPQTPYVPLANTPYASLGANFVDPRMYQNPLFSQLLATGGKVHGNNAMGNAIRMAMGYKS